MSQSSGRDKVFGVTSRGLLRIPGLETMLDAQVGRVPWFKRGRLDGLLGWGRRPQSERAKALAGKAGLPFVCVEDGFLRSVDLGPDAAPLSIVVDDQGIYFDATGPSRFEALMKQQLDDSGLQRATAIQAAWRAARVSKYNHLREHCTPLPQRYVLVVDQTAGDASISFGLANQATFERMLHAALHENPDCSVVVKIHPDVFSGRKQGHYDVRAIEKMDRVKVLAEDVHPVGLVERCEAVYVVTSQLGFEALIWGKRVRVFGMPFYAGWGLTSDDLARPSRRTSRSLAQLIYAALVAYPRYLDPETGVRCEVERVLDWMGLQRRMRERFPQTLHAVGFSMWKRPLVRSFFQGSNVHFVREPAQIPSDGTGIVWGRGLAPTGMSIIRLEDGFLRSVGLGAHLVRPLSWVQDARGIYFDARSPSDLEVILKTAEFSPSAIERAGALRAALIQSGLTKYNLSGRHWVRPPQAVRKTVVLVPGQVESDASIAWGASSVRRNMDLLRHVREANPQAWVIYKPHPDVVSGMRKRGDGETEALRWCDEVIQDAPMGSLLEVVDEVHTMTSLAGFEGLIRGRRVVCYGQPFYAGWGLTDDLMPFSNDRRNRATSIDCLVAGVLLEYPTYVSFVTKRFATAERALQELHSQSNNKNKGIFRRGFRYCLRVAVSVQALIKRK